MTTTTMTCLLFEKDLDEAAALYTSLVPDSRILSSEPWPEGSERSGQTLAVDLTIGGARYQLISGGPAVALTEVVSIKLEVDDQSEVDRLWDALLAGGGQPSRCGWLTDRFGLSWQLVPRGFTELMAGADAATRQRLFAAMLEMGKLEMPVFERIASGE